MKSAKSRNSVAIAKSPSPVSRVAARVAFMLMRSGSAMRAATSEPARGGSVCSTPWIDMFATFLKENGHASSWKRCWAGRAL